MLALYDREQRREIEYPGMSRQVLPRLVRYVRPAPGMSFVLHSDLDEGSADAAINEQLAYFAALQQPFEWKVYEMCIRDSDHRHAARFTAGAGRVAL